VKRVLVLFAVTFAIGVPASSQPASGRAEVLVVGTYHMANPGHDIFNVQVDDVLAPKRHAEIEQVIAALKKFQPTKIAIEADAGDDRIAKRYADYLAGKYELSRNEIDQIGLRLAKELGHKAVYAVDADGDFPYLRLVDYAKANGRSNELDAIMSIFADGAKAQGAYLASHTILETMLYMNSDERAAREVGAYFQLARLGQAYDWAGADLVADWFRRNVRIYSNVVRLIDSSNDRILVVFGAGHLGWLRQDVSSNPDLRLRTLAEFAR
jgi:uncharacterized protein DUF5694